MNNWINFVDVYYIDVNLKLDNNGLLPEQNKQIYNFKSLSLL